MRGVSGTGKMFKHVDTQRGIVTVRRVFGHVTKVIFTGRKQSAAKAFIRYKNRGGKTKRYVSI